MDELHKLIPILIVDDNPENLLVHQAVLRNSERKIVTAESGEEALKLIQKYDFAVVLLDIQMPVMDGYEVAERIKQMKNEESPPIIFITAGMNENSQVLKGYTAGAVDYLFKPVEPHILRAKVEIFVQLYKAKQQIARQAEILRMHDQQERDSFLENALDAVIAMNEAGEIIYWNRQAEIIFGWKKEEVLGQILAKTIIPLYYRPNHEIGLRHFLRTGEGPILGKRIEVSAVRRDGTEFPVELAVSPILLKNNYTFSAFVRDISERKLEQLKLKKAIQARDEFISVCSHELKTPLTSMQLQFQLAQKMYRRNDERVFSRENMVRRIENANRQLIRMGTLIENMLDVSRMGTGKLTIEKTDVDLVSIVNDVLETFREQIDEQEIKVSVINKSQGPALIYADGYRIEQVISNLLTNALKYGKSKPIEIIIRKPAGKVSLSVVDHGLGIEHENIDRIFERYERAIAASEISGLGLGLYISKQIVEAHNGKLFVKSEKNSGSTFTIEFPDPHFEAELSH